MMMMMVMMMMMMAVVVVVDNDDDDDDDVDDDGCETKSLRIDNNLAYKYNIPQIISSSDNIRRSLISCSKF